jgi:hypothetical protein
MLRTADVAAGSAIAVLAATTVPRILPDGLDTDPRRPHWQ